MKDLKISNSKLNTWRKCHRAYHYKYILKLRKKIKSSALQRGSIIHECIEYYNNGKSWKKPFERFRKTFYENTFIEERIMLGDIPSMVESLMENYVRWTEEDELEYLENELEFNLPLMPGVVFNGFLDSLVKDEKGKIWTLERKTYAKEPSRDFLVFNTQSAIYTWACQQLGYNSQGTIWEIIKAKEPSKPKLTSKGILSQASLDSTPYTVERGLKELGLNPKDYKDFIKGFSYESFFQRHKVLVNDSIVNLIMEDCKATASEILEKGDTLKDRNLNRDCSFCEFKELCQAELMGLDYSYIISHEFEVKEESEKDEKQKHKK